MAVTHRRRFVIAVVATTLVLGTVTWFWVSSLVPSTYSVLAMGYPDYGGGTSGSVSHHVMSGIAGPVDAGGRPVDSLTVGTDRPADLEVYLIARRQVFRLAGGRSVDGYTLNGTSPGPLIRGVQGQLVEVRLINESAPDGITLHWHGLDVPNAEDGVAGVTQDAVPVGGEHVYRFILRQAGTYWYHSHQVSHEQVIGGLLGALVIAPVGAAHDGTSTGGDAGTADEVALVHIYDGQRTINGRDGDSSVTAAPGTRVRVRVINTDNGPMAVWVTGADFRLIAVDGTDLNEPTPVVERSVQVTAGGRADVELVMPADSSGVRVEMGGSNSLLFATSPGSTVPAHTGQPPPALDLLSYGSPASLGLDPANADRSFEYSIGRRPGFLDGLPGLWWTINGHLFPDVPMFVVSDGDVVRMHIQNGSGEVHPMHLHGHHAVVVARDGIAATGSPWWIDSLNVGDGESYDIAFRADNPGIWMDHCHNLPHATEGLVTHLMYEDVTEPYLVGGPSDNQPE